MKKQLDIKKLLILNLPYLLMGLFATNFGEAWRMAQGADASAKMLSFFSTLPLALDVYKRQQQYNRISFLRENVDLCHILPFFISETR